MNLLHETIEKLKDNGKTIDDVKWVGNKNAKTTWEQFSIIADVEYGSGYKASEVAEDLLIVGNDFWLERYENDGSEWWEYKGLIREPKERFELKAVTVGQAKKLGIELYGWDDLLEINAMRRKK